MTGYENIRQVYDNYGTLTTETTVQYAAAEVRRLERKLGGTFVALPVGATAMEVLTALQRRRDRKDRAAYKTHAKLEARRVPDSDRIAQAVTEALAAEDWEEYRNLIDYRERHEAKRDALYSRRPWVAQP